MKLSDHTIPVFISKCPSTRKHHHPVSWSTSRRWCMSFCSTQEVGSSHRQGRPWPLPSSSPVWWAAWQSWETGLWWLVRWPFFWPFTNHSRWKVLRNWCSYLSSPLIFMLGPNIIFNGPPPVETIENHMFSSLDIDFHFGDQHQNQCPGIIN